jgi:hypothetical protein
MNPEMMNSMMGMLNNPDTMEKMNDMMKNPQIQSMLNNPEMMQNMMGMFGIPDMRENTEAVSEDVVTDLKDKYDKIENAEKNIDELETKFNPEDIVILDGLKTEKYNNKRGIIQSYNIEKSRYVVLLDEDDIRIMVKEDNLSIEVEENATVDIHSEETVIQID